MKAIIFSSLATMALSANCLAQQCSIAATSTRSAEDEGLTSGLFISVDYGSEVSFDGNTLAVAVPGDNSQSLQNGSVYVYNYTTSGWTNPAVIQSPTMSPETRFADDVCVSSNYLLIANKELGLADGSAAMIYTYHFNGTWQFTGSFLPNHSTVGVDSEPHNFIDISSNLAVVNGLIYEFTNGSWNLTTDLNGINDDGEQDFFGTENHFSPDGTLIAVAAPTHDDNANQSTGAVYLYTYSGSTWEVLDVAIPPHGGQYTKSIALSDEFLVTQLQLNGSRYLEFNRISPNGFSSSQLVPIQNDFRYGIAIDGTTVVSSEVNNQFDDIIVFYQFAGNQWGIDFSTETPNSSAEFGQSLAISGDSLFVGIPSWHPTGSGTSLGSVRNYDINCTLCYSDINRDGAVNFFDTSAFIVEYNNNSPIGDWNGDGEWNFFDVSAFLQDEQLGCQ